MGDQNSKKYPKVKLFDKLESPFPLSKIVMSIRPPLLLLGTILLFSYYQELDFQKQLSNKDKNEEIKFNPFQKQYCNIRKLVDYRAIRMLDLIEK